MELAEGNYCDDTFVIAGTRGLWDRDRRQIFYTDGAVGNPSAKNGHPDAVGGCAYYSGEECKSSWEVPYERAPDGSRHRFSVTNQNAELLAVLGALQRAFWDGQQAVLIRTDSQ